MLPHGGLVYLYFPEQFYDKDLLTYIVKNEDDIDYSELYDVIKKVNIDPSLLEDRHLIKTLSGGEKVKASLARMLYERPDTLLLDEPTNDLDLQTLIWLEEFIKNENRAIIFISHDETMLENCSNGIIHLEQLKRKTETKISFSGENYQEYIKNRSYNIKRNNEIAAKEKAEYHKQLEKYRQS